MLFGMIFLLLIWLNVKINTQYIYIFYMDSIYSIPTKSLCLRIVNNIYTITQFLKRKILYISVREIQISIQGKIKIKSQYM